jgi:hypothetical protein
MSVRIAGTLATAALVGLSQGCSSAGAKPACTELLDTRVALEENLTDGDAEVLIFAKAPDEGLRRLTVSNPAGVEIQVTTPNALGQREFLFESAEPPDLDAVLSAFPQGSYGFSGTTVSGGCVKGSAEFSHVSAPPTTLLTPMSDEVVAGDQVDLSWTTVPEAASYVVELTHESSGAVYSFEIYPPQTSVHIPAELLSSGTTYTFAVATKATSGNLSSVELRFTTEPRRSGWVHGSD